MRTVEQRRIIMAQLRRCAVRWGMTTKMEGQWIWGYNRGIQRWVRLEHIF